MNVCYTFIWFRFQNVTYSTNISEVIVVSTKILAYISSVAGYSIRGDRCGGGWWMWRRGYHLVVLIWWHRNLTNCTKNSIHIMQILHVRWVKIHLWYIALIYLRIWIVIWRSCVWEYCMSERSIRFTPLKIIIYFFRSNMKFFSFIFIIIWKISPLLLGIFSWFRDKSIILLITFRITVIVIFTVSILVFTLSWTKLVNISILVLTLMIRKQKW